jgi:Ca2+-transporting ATPase
MVEQYDLGVVGGLTEEKAARRLKEEGLNDIPSGKKRTVFRTALDIVKEPMFLLLVIAGTIYLILGDLQGALILLSFVFLVMGITFYQERRTERALDSLRDLSSPRALVIRDGRQKRIAGVEVVRDDVLVLTEGDRVPADAIVLACANLMADESLLSGESAPVNKIPCDGFAEMERPGGDGQPFVYAGTLVVKGHGLARVKATGDRTEMGLIGKALEEIKPETTLLKKETGLVVRNIAILGLALCTLVVVIYGATRDDWIKGLLVGITLAMAMLPEEFPVVLTVFLTLGAWRISKNQVLTRNMPAVETLGSATVLCVDKTGTLTLNRMTVSKIMADGAYYDCNESPACILPEKFHELVEFSILASQRDPFDPVETAITQLGDRALNNTEHLHYDWILEREYPLSAELMALSHVWRSPNGQDYVIAAKGAPEAVADLCHLDGARKEELTSHIEELAAGGLRLLGVAKASFTLPYLPKHQHDFVFEFLGLIGLQDPVRPTVADSIKECYKAGIRVVMITGDYPGTAQNVAGQIGLEPNDQFITGMELEQMNDTELQERIKTVNIFARVVPEQKLRIVKALKANGEIVAMTGDGVNDAPALKAANIGVAMGARGTDVAREASSLVLLDDDFSSIEKAVRMGRRIYDNLKKAMSYIIAVHVPIAGMSLIPVLFKLPLVFAPIHIAFLEIIIDPACSLVFEAEPEEQEVMRRPPRLPDERVFNKRNVVLSLLQGLGVLLIVVAVFAISLIRGIDEAEVRTLTFTTLVVANLALILTNRSWERTIRETLHSRNVALWWIMGGTLAVLGAALYVPFMRKLFQFTSLSATDLGMCLAAGVLSVTWFEGLKVFRQRRKKIRIP